MTAHVAGDIQAYLLLQMKQLKQRKKKKKGLTELAKKNVSDKIVL